MESTLTTGPNEHGEPRIAEARGDGNAGGGPIDRQEQMSAVTTTEYTVDRLETRVEAQPGHRILMPDTDLPKDHPGGALWRDMWRGEMLRDYPSMLTDGKLYFDLMRMYAGLNPWMRVRGPSASVMTQYALERPAPPSEKIYKVTSPTPLVFRGYDGLVFVSCFYYPTLNTRGAMAIVRTPPGEPLPPLYAEDDSGVKNEKTGKYGTGRKVTMRSQGRHRARIVTYYSPGGPSLVETPLEKRPHFGPVFVERNMADPENIGELMVKFSAEEGLIFNDDKVPEGWLFRLWRKKIGMFQKDAARQAGVSVKTIRRFERGEHISRENAAKLKALQRRIGYYEIKTFPEKIKEIPLIEERIADTSPGETPLPARKRVTSEPDDSWSGEDERVPWRPRPEFEGWKVKTPGFHGPRELEAAIADRDEPFEEGDPEQGDEDY